MATSMATTYRLLVATTYILVHIATYSLQYDWNTSCLRLLLYCDKDNAVGFFNLRTMETPEQSKGIKLAFGIVTSIVTNYCCLPYVCCNSWFIVCHYC